MALPTDPNAEVLEHLRSLLRMPSEERLASLQSLTVEERAALQSLVKELREHLARAEAEFGLHIVEPESVRQERGH